MTKKVKLPLLPSSKPEGSMAIYLAHALQERETRQQPETSPPADSVDATGDSNVDTHQTSSDTIQLGSDTAQSGPFQTQNNSAVREEIAELSTAALTKPTEEPNQVSKILDKSGELDPTVTAEQVINREQSGDGLAIDSETGGGQGTRRFRSKSEPTPSSGSDLVSYLKALPLVYTSATFTKGEMQIRISENMADLLRILNECSIRIGHPKYLADNLVNQLLQDFFVQYASNIDQLIAENQQLQRRSHQEKLRLLKSKYTSM